MVQGWMKAAEEVDPRYQDPALKSLLASPSPPPSTHTLCPPGTPFSGAPPSASTEELAALVNKEQLNGYGVMAACGPEGERRTRGSGLYHQASLTNHECNPNMARFDAFDGTSVRLAFRAMHDLPAGGLVGVWGTGSLGNCAMDDLPPGGLGS